MPRSESPLVCTRHLRLPKKAFFGKFCLHPSLWAAHFCSIFLHGTCASRLEIKRELGSRRWFVKTTLWIFEHHLYRKLLGRWPNAWGIQHLHFRPEGTDPILFCRITDTDVFVIQALPHNDDAWVDTRLLQILHDNWPEEIAVGKIRGIPAEVVPSNKRLSLRNQNANFTTTMTDGTVYLAPGGGLMASGECSEDRTHCDKIFSELAYWQQIVTGNATSVRAALKE